MSSEVLWSVIGISVSVVFGLVGIYLTLRSRYSGRITFVDEQTIELFDSVGNTIEKLEVSYDGNLVSDNLVLLNGAFVNSGKSDITPEMVEQPISICLPEGYKWLSGNMVESNINAQLVIESDSKLSIRTGLFRRNEFVRFHALAQLPNSTDNETNGSNLKQALTFSHRITNTSDIDTSELDERTVSKTYLKSKLTFPLIMLILTLGVGAYALYKGVPHQIVYPIEFKHGSEQVLVKPLSEDLVRLVSVESDYEQEMSLGEYIRLKKGNPISIERNDYYILWVIGLQSLLLGLLVALVLFYYFKNRKLLKIFNRLK